MPLPITLIKHLFDDFIISRGRAQEERGIQHLRYQRRHLKIGRRLTIALGSVFTLAVLLALYLIFSNPSTPQQPSPTQEEAIVSPNASMPSDLPDAASASVYDESYLLIDINTNQVLLSQNTELQRAPASTTKLLTGLVALQKLDRSQIVTVGEEVNVEGSRLGLQPGDKISVDDLLNAMYIISANDAAAALAVETSGSLPAFAEEMNAYASSVGAHRSHFTTPHGLSDPEHYTTATDLSLIAKAFLQQPILMEYVQTREDTISWTDGHGNPKTTHLQNTNHLLGIYPGVQGLKTGRTTEAGQCLVTYSTSSDGQLLLVLLGSEQRYVDTVKLLDQGWAKLRSQNALKAAAKDQASFFASPGFFAP